MRRRGSRRKGATAFAGPAAGLADASATATAARCCSHYTQRELLCRHFTAIS